MRDGLPRARAAKVVVVTGCDAAHFDLAEDLFTSILAVKSRDYALGFVRLCGSPPPAALRRPGIDTVSAPGWDLPSPPRGYRAAFLNVKPRLPVLFPGFDVYIWIDADCWVQGEGWFDALVEGAFRADLCAHPEYDVHYLGLPTPNDRTIDIYTSLFDLEVARAVWRYPMVNAGVFSARATSPLWGRWSAALEAIRARPAPDLFVSDQIPLHHLIHTRALSLFPLRAVDNWQTYACLPGIDHARRRLIVPTPPHEDINVVHLAGGMKTLAVPIPALGRSVTLRYRAVRALFDGFAPGPQPGPNATG